MGAARRRAEVSGWMQSDCNPSAEGDLKRECKETGQEWGQQRKKRISERFDLEGKLGRARLPTKDKTSSLWSCKWLVACLENEWFRELTGSGIRNGL